MQILRILLMGCALGLAIGSRAQDPPRRTKFAVYVWPAQGIMTSSTVVKGLPPLYYQDETGEHRIRATRGQTTRFHKYVGTGPIVLYRKEQQRDPETGESVTQNIPYARVTFPVQREFMTVLIFPERQSVDGVAHSVSLDFHPDKAPKGKATIYNGSRRPVRFVVKNSVYNLQPGERTILSRAQVETRRMQGRSMFHLDIYARDHKQRWRSIPTGSHFLNGDTPCLFVIMEYGERRLQVQQITTLPQPVDDE